MQRNAFPVVLMLGAILHVAMMSTGCSVGMALHGTREPDLSSCRVGATRAELESRLGPPIYAHVNAKGDTTCTYEYELGNKPAPGRAAVHAGLDVLTLGLWEIVGTPVEAWQGDTFHLSVTYDADGTVTSIRSQKKH